MARVPRQAGPIGLALTAYDVWRRLSPRQRRLIVRQAQKYGPAVAAQAIRSARRAAARRCGAATLQVTRWLARFRPVSQRGADDPVLPPQVGGQVAHARARPPGPADVAERHAGGACLLEARTGVGGDHGDHHSEHPAAAGDADRDRGEPPVTAADARGDERENDRSDADPHGLHLEVRAGDAQVQVGHREQPDEDRGRRHQPGDGVEPLALPIGRARRSRLGPRPGDLPPVAASGTPCGPRRGPRGGRAAGASPASGRSRSQQAEAPARPARAWPGRPTRRPRHR